MMKIIKKILQYLPVTRKTVEEINEYYAEIINGLLLSEQQHCQLESAILAKLEEQKAKKAVDSADTNNGDNMIYA